VAAGLGLDQLGYSHWSPMSSKILKISSSQLHELSVVAAAQAIKDGSLTSVAYATALLRRYHEHADLNAFITVNDDAVLEASSVADSDRKAGKPLGPLHGVPIGIKDSINTHDLPTSVGTKILAGFRPKHDAAIVTPLRSAGAVLFGKNNLVEMSYGLIGVNEHYGQAKNPYNKARITGGSSSGAGASVAARLIPAALGGDTVGSIRVPAALCGVVGFRPTTGRWSGRGVAPIAHTLDTNGPMARTVEDCALLDAVITGRSPVDTESFGRDLKGLRLGFAPKQHLDLIDAEVEQTFRQSLAKLREAGAVIIEIDLGDDFMPLAMQANWPIFFHETMPSVTRYLEDAGAPATFNEIYEDLGPDVKLKWGNAVVTSSRGYISKEGYREALDVYRPALQKRYEDSYRSNGIDGLIYPTTPTVAPQIGAGEYTIAGKVVDPLTIGKNGFASSCAGLPGISLPMGLSSDGLPIGLEIDGQPNSDPKVLDLATRISRILGSIPPPSN
jgi:Asp-tRNA(Asn)/Glu-tRNA(Gln) amidotransferase A subunit family amidase